jgi:hypothetical protein
MPQFGDMFWQRIATTNLNPEETKERLIKAAFPYHINSDNKPFIA